MSGINRRYDGEYEGRGRTGEIFRLIDIGDILCGNSTRGFGFHNDFLSNGDISDWTLTNTTPVGADSTFAAGDAAGGAALLSTVTVTAAEGGQIQYGAGEMFLPAAGTTIAGEMLVTFTGVANLNIELFFGLAVEDTTVIASSLNSTDNHIGFEAVGDDGVIAVVGEKATARGTTAAVHTIVSGTAVRLGFRVNGVTNIEFYVDRVLVSDTILTANIPVVEMTPTLVVQTGGTDAPIATIDWIDVFQQDKGD